MKSQTITVTVRIPKQTHLIVQSCAAREGQTIAEYLRSLVYDDLEDREKRSEAEEMERRLSSKLDDQMVLLRKIGSFVKSRLPPLEK